jgi:hypothetical protein
MSDTTQTTGAATTEPGGTQTAAATTPAAGEGAATTATPGATTTTAPAGEGAATTGEEVYEFAKPEGMELDQGDLDKFTALAKESKLPKDVAQKVVDLAIAREQARADAFIAQVKAWGDEVKADPILGKAENVAVAVKAIEAFGTPELKQLLESTGLGNHPVVVRWAYEVGKAISEDGIIRGRNTPSSEKSLADALYGSTPKQ